MAAAGMQEFRVIGRPTSALPPLFENRDCRGLFRRQSRPREVDHRGRSAFSPQKGPPHRGQSARNGRTYSSRAWERLPPPGTYDFPDHVSRRPRTRACRLRPREATLSLERPYIEHNTRERDRLRALVERLDDDALRSKVNDQWTVAGVLGHIAFWDARALVLGEKLERGVPFSPSDAEPEELEWI